MKTAMDAIRDRRSCRAYKSEPLKDGELEMILEAAILAPSAKNLQERHITVITDRNYLDELNEKMCEKISRSPDEYHIFHHAPAVLVLSAPDTARWGREDMGILSENIALAAESIGIGSVILGLPQMYYETQEANEDIEKLGVPEGYRPVLCVSLGYKANDDIPAKPRNRGVVSYIK